LLSIAGSPDARFAALIGGSVEATVVNSPFEYRAEQEGFKVLLPIKETAESVKSDQRVEHVAAEIARKPDEIGACCAHCTTRIGKISARSVPG
jgi:hypothetical protein